jgi:hypothetical protein
MPQQGKCVPVPLVTTGERTDRAGIGSLGPWLRCQWQWHCHHATVQPQPRQRSEDLAPRATVLVHARPWCQAPCTL